MKEINLGAVMMTKGTLGLMENDCRFRPFINNCLQRHKMNDWGDLSDGDKALNDESLLTDGRLLSEYQYTGKVRIKIITEADRSVTTVLLPNEY